MINHEAKQIPAALIWHDFINPPATEVAVPSLPKEVYSFGSLLYQNRSVMHQGKK